MSHFNFLPPPVRIGLQSVRGPHRDELLLRARDGHRAVPGLRRVPRHQRHEQEVLHRLVRGLLAHRGLLRRDPAW